MLNTYARRLKEKNLQKPEDASEQLSSFAEKRRLIINQITEKYADKLIAKISQGEDAASSQKDQKLTSPSDSRFFYHIIDEQDRKIRNSLELQDPEFLIKQVELMLENTGSEE